MKSQRNIMSFTLQAVGRCCNYDDFLYGNNSIECLSLLRAALCQYYSSGNNKLVRWQHRAQCYESTNKDNNGYGYDDLWWILIHKLNQVYSARWLPISFFLHDFIFLETRILCTPLSGLSIKYIRQFRNSLQETQMRNYDSLNGR